MDGFHGDISNKKHVRVKATTPRIINMSVASHSWGKSGVTQTSGWPSDFWHMTVRPSRTEPGEEPTQESKFAATLLEVLDLMVGCPFLNDSGVDLGEGGIGLLNVLI